VVEHHRRFLAPYEHLASPFGADKFGQNAERVARFFGTPRYIVGQTIVVIAWLALNSVALIAHWDPYPFILLNLAFSTQAAYAAPLILLAQTRQAERDKAHADADARHREAVAHESLEHQRLAEEGLELLRRLLEQNTQLTEQVNALTKEIHGRIVAS
jgi:uncharacterized membrane protein